MQKRKQKKGEKKLKKLSFNLIRDVRGLLDFLVYILHLMQ